MNCKVIKKWQPPVSISSPPLQVYPPFLAKKFVLSPKWLNFWRSYPSPLIREEGFQLWTSFYHSKYKALLVLIYENVLYTELVFFNSLCEKKFLKMRFLQTLCNLREFIWKLSNFANSRKFLLVKIASLKVKSYPDWV